MGSRYTQVKEHKGRHSLPPARSRSKHTDLGFTRAEGVKYRDVPTFSFAIMAHEKRKHWVPYLEENIPGAEVVWDRYNDRHETGLRSILEYDPDADYHVVVQDDALLCNDFVGGLAEAMQYVPDGLPVGLYHGRTRNHNDLGMNRAVSSGASWLCRSGPVWGPGIVFPTESIPDLTEFYQSIPDVPNYDRRVLRYYQKVGKQCFYPVPSLIEHRTEDNPSLASPSRTAHRMALKFIGPRSALSVDWSGPVIWAQKL